MSVTISELPLARRALEQIKRNQNFGGLITANGVNIARFVWVQKYLFGVIPMGKVREQRYVGKLHLAVSKNEPQPVDNERLPSKGWILDVWGEEYFGPVYWLAQDLEDCFHTSVHIRKMDIHRRTDEYCWYL